MCALHSEALFAFRSLRLLWTATMERVGYLGQCPFGSFDGAYENGRGPGEINLLAIEDAKDLPEFFRTT